MCVCVFIHLYRYSENPEPQSVAAMTFTEPSVLLRTV